MTHTGMEAGMSDGLSRPHLFWEQRLLPFLFFLTMLPLFHEYSFHFQIKLPKKNDFDALFFIPPEFKY